MNTETQVAKTAMGPSWLRLDLPHETVQKNNLIYDYLEDASLEDSAFSRCGHDSTFSSYVTRENIENRVQDFVSRFGLDDKDKLSSLLSGVKVMADLGSGPGIYVQWLARLFPDKEVISLDSSGMLPAFDLHFGRLDNVTLILADLDQALPFFDGSLDLVIMDYVLSHVNRPDEVLARVAEKIPAHGVLAVSFSLEQSCIRTLSDNYLRSVYAKDQEKADLLAGEMTLLAKELDELGLTVALKNDYPNLGIGSGELSLQRFIYHYFLKCFWNGDQAYSLKRNRNNFTYPWRLFKPEEALSMVEEHFNIHYLHQDRSTLSILAGRKALGEG
ncbi:class I SAM-dependent methyltransferase [Dethiosulfatarculus sandiegensis]|nr:class I SAM-dependent methyltransferase [Dethiosulfatarculus sandiegensis]